MKSALNTTRAGIFNRTRLAVRRHLVIAVLALISGAMATHEARASRMVRLGGIPEGLDQIDKTTWHRILALRAETDLEVLQEAMTDPSPQVRFVAVSAAGNLGYQALAAFDDIALVLADDPSPRLQNQCAQALRLIGADPDRITVALGREIMPMSGGCNVRLRLPPSPGALSLDQVLANVDDRALLATLLHHVEMEAAIDTIRSWLANDDNPRRQLAALQQVTRLLPASEAGSHIVRLMQSEDVEVSRAAIRATSTYRSASEQFVPALLEDIASLDTGVDRVDALVRLGAVNEDMAPTLVARFEAEITRAQGCADRGHYGDRCRNRLEIVARAVQQVDREATYSGLQRMLTSPCEPMAQTAGRLLRGQKDLPVPILELVVARALSSDPSARSPWLPIISQARAFDRDLTRTILLSAENATVGERYNLARQIGSLANQDLRLRNILLEQFDSDDASVRIMCTLALANVTSLNHPGVHRSLNEIAVAAMPDERAPIFGQMHQTEQIQGALPLSGSLRSLAARE